MHRWDKSHQTRLRENQTHHQFDSQTPTFCSTFLDQINGPRNRGRSFEEDKMPTLRTAFSMEKWTEKKVNDNVIARRRNPSFSTPSSPSTNRLDQLDLQDTLFFSTSETDYPVFQPPKSALPPRPKQPISPGARLSRLIRSLFTKQVKTKRSNNTEKNYSCMSAQTSTRSCLSRNSSKKKSEDGVKRTVRFSPVGVIFGEDSHPCGHKYLFDCEDDCDFVSSTENNDKAMLEQQEQRQQQLQQTALDLLNGYWDSNLSKSHYQKDNDDVNRDSYDLNHRQNLDEQDDNDDGISCSSSDLFELDHLSSPGDELHLYVTTHFNS